MYANDALEKILLVVKICSYLNLLNTKNYEECGEVTVLY